MLTQLTQPTAHIAQCNSERKQQWFSDKVMIMYRDLNLAEFK
jgi:hypothetical protein